jgi:hypothetical protein
MNKLNSCFALAPTNANTLIHFLPAIIHSFGNATETLLHDVTISQLDLTCVDQAHTKTPNSKTHVIISTHNMSQHIFYVLYKPFPLKVIIYIALSHTIKIGIFIK